MFNFKYLFMVFMKQIRCILEEYFVNIHIYVSFIN